MTAPLGREDLRRLVDGRDDDAIYDALEAPGIDATLDAVFEGMAKAFLPERAGDAAGIIQWDVGTPRGTRVYQLVIGDGACRARRGAPEPARVRLIALLPDFLRIVSGARDPMQAYFQRSLAATGDVLFAQRQTDWFAK